MIEQRDIIRALQIKGWKINTTLMLMLSQAKSELEIQHREEATDTHVNRWYTDDDTTRLIGWFDKLQSSG